jgi:hypothetical protein
MIATLQYNLPDDADALRHALDGDAMAAALRELREFIRNQRKHGPGTIDADAMWQAWHDAVQDEGIDVERLIDG